MSQVFMMHVTLFNIIHTSIIGNVAPVFIWVLISTSNHGVVTQFVVLLRSSEGIYFQRWYLLIACSGPNTTFFGSLENHERNRSRILLILSCLNVLVTKL
jgi:hypothetical protein